jgi:hypothetical protein
MPTYVEYDLGDGTTVLIEGPGQEESGGLVPAGMKKEDKPSVKAKKTFAAALKDVRAQAKFLLSEIEELNVQEAEVKFGVNTVGELGNLAIGKLGIGVNYEVTLKWKKPSVAST